MKRTGAVLTATTVLLLTACYPASTAAPDTTPATDCLTITQDAIDGIQWGIDDRNGPDSGITPATTTAIKVDTGWIVAATLNGPGMDGTSAAWHTTQDPTSTGTFAYTSADPIAAEFTTYAPLDTQGADEAKACLK